MHPSFLHGVSPNALGEGHCVVTCDVNSNVAVKGCLPLIQHDWSLSSSWFDNNVTLWLLQ